MSLPEPSFALLHMISGYHAGTCCEFSGAISIGSSGQDSIILADPSVEPHHLELKLVGSDIFLKPLQKQVCIDGEELEVGSEYAVTLPVVFHLGSVEMKCTRETDEKSENFSEEIKDIAIKNLYLTRIQNILSRPLWFGAAIGIIILIGFVFISGRSQADRLIAPVVKDKPIASNVISDEKIIEITDSKLNGSGFQNITVSVSSGLVELNGTIKPEMEQKLKAILTWFDAEFGTHYVMLSHVDIKEPQIPKFVVDAIWVDKNSSVIIAGKTYALNDTLPGNYKLESIDKNKLVVSRQGHSFDVVY